ncbi:MAG TPA: CapA family protein, partial [Acidobacteriota bacterium]|nr:CapA family protein [Acidobacteriota bacterium]
ARCLPPDVFRLLLSLWNCMKSRILLLLGFCFLGLVVACTVDGQPATAQSPASTPAAKEPPAQSVPAATSASNIVFMGVGDIMLGSTYPDESGLPPNDGADLLKEATPILTSADLAFGNLEGPMLEGGTTTKCGPKSTRCFAFRVPTRYGKHLKDAGIDVMSLANNHANDFGSQGMASSKKVLDELGIAHAGEIGDIAYMTVKGRKIAIIGFATNAVSYNVNDIEIARRVVADTTKKADLVIVSFHGGAEGTANLHVPDQVEIFLGETRGHLRKFARTVIDAGADLVIGHGPHVCRGMEVYKDRFIAYSLGNFATYGKFNLAEELGKTMILEVHIDPKDGAFRGGKIHPFKQIKPGGPLADSSKAIIPLMKQLSESDFGDTSVKISDDGTISF